MDGKIKTWTVRFPAKENPNMEKALFDWLNVLQYDVKPKCRLISRKFSNVKSFHPSVRLTNQKPRTFCIRSTNQSNLSISVRLLLLCRSRVFISRSYENRSIWHKQQHNNNDNKNNNKTTATEKDLTFNSRLKILRILPGVPHLHINRPLIISRKRDTPSFLPTCTY